MSDHVTLSNPTAETMVLGAMMIDAPAVVEQLPTLTGDMFYNPRNGALYDLMIDLLKREIPVDVSTVCDVARHSPTKFGPLTSITELSDNVPSVQVRHWCKRVQELSEARALQSRLYSAVGALEGGASLSDVQELLDSAERSMAESTGFVHVRDIAPEAMQRSIDRRELSQSGRSIFLPMPTKAMTDNLLIPVGEPYLVTLGGRPAHGKTAVALDIGRTVAGADIWDPNAGAWCKGSVLTVSLEMTKERLVGRLATQFSGVNYVAFEANQCDRNAASEYHHGMERVAELNLSIDDRPGQTPSEVCRSIRRHARIHGAVHLVIIDYIEKFSFRDLDKQRPTAIAEACGLIYNTLKDIRAGCILLAQLKRDIDSRPGHRPMMSDFAGSSGIEKESDVALALTRPAMFGGESGGGGGGQSMIAADDTVDFHVFKARNGTTGKFSCGWNGAAFRTYDKDTGGY